MEIEKVHIQCLTVCFVWGERVEVLLEFIFLAIIGIIFILKA